MREIDREMTAPARASEMEICSQPAVRERATTPARMSKPAVINMPGLNLMMFVTPW